MSTTSDNSNNSNNNESKQPQSIIYTSPEFGTVNGYEPNKNKSIGSQAPNKSAGVGFTLYWDLVFPTGGTYSIHLTAQFVGATGLECGLMLPGEKLVMGISPNKPAHVFPSTPKPVRVCLGTLDIPNAGTHPIFVRITKSSGRLLLINSISVSSQLPDAANVKVFELRTQGIARLAHHAAAAYSRSFFTVSNPQFIYREFIPTQWRPNTFTTVAFNGGYVGIVVGKSTGMSIWNAPNGKPNQILETGVGVKTKTYDHEGSGVQFSLPYIVKEGQRYGYMMRLELHPISKELPSGASDYSSWFIDLSSTGTPEWKYIGKVRRFCRCGLGGGNGKTTKSSIGGFLENPSTSNGHLYVRKVAVGNGWASADGREWVPSCAETYNTKNWHNAQGGPYTWDPNMIEYAIGGRVSCPNSGNYTLKPDPTSRPVLTHLLAFTKLIYPNGIPSLPNGISHSESGALIPDDAEDAFESAEELND
jgi:hypothetical protein